MAGIGDGLIADSLHSQLCPSHEQVGPQCEVAESYPCLWLCIVETGKDWEDGVVDLGTIHSNALSHTNPQLTTCRVQLDTSHLGVKELFYCPLSVGLKDNLTICTKPFHLEFVF